MKPILSARKRSSSVALIEATLTPSIFNSPAVGRSRHPIKFTSVLLPEPDGPVIATHSPATIEKEASDNARTTPPCPTYSRVTRCSAITAQSSRVAPERSTSGASVCNLTSLTLSILSFALQQRRRLQSAQHPHRQQRRQCRNRQIQQQHQRQHRNMWQC